MKTFRLKDYNYKSTCQLTEKRETMVGPSSLGKLL